MIERRIIRCHKTADSTGAITFAVTVRYSDSADSDFVTHDSTAVFHGSFYGSPGPVVVSLGAGEREDQLFVIEPARFGERFDREWINRYYEIRPDVRTNTKRT